jgi:NOL1/NOP2/fmu family ribosome biogenesis protein
MKIQILDKTKKKKFIEGLSDLGMKKIPELLVRSGEERIRAFSGDLSTEQIMDIWRLLHIEGVGLYVGKDLVNRNGVHEIRLSLDGMHVWKAQLTEKILVLTEKQEIDWFLGRDIELDESQKMLGGFVCVKSSDGNDFVGIGKVGTDRKTLFSFLPKERRRKERMG